MTSGEDLATTVEILGDAARRLPPTAFKKKQRRAESLGREVESPQVAKIELHRIRGQQSNADPLAMLEKPRETFDRLRVRVHSDLLHVVLPVDQVDGWIDETAELVASRLAREAGAAAMDVARAWIASQAQPGDVWRAALWAQGAAAMDGIQSGDIRLEKTP